MENVKPIRWCMPVIGVLLGLWVLSLGVSLVGVLILTAPFVLFWFWAPHGKPFGITLSACLLVLITIGGIMKFVVLCDDAQCGLGFLYIIPLQYAALALATLHRKK